MCDDDVDVFVMVCVNECGFDDVDVMTMCVESKMRMKLRVHDGHDDGDVHVMMCSDDVSGMMKCGGMRKTKM